MLDKKAEKILMSTYWNNGWRFNVLSTSEIIEKGFITQADFDYAKSKGLMFDDETLTHDEMLKRTLEAYQKIDIQDIIKAFLSSLSTKALYQRSAITSYNYASKLSAHKYECADEDGYTCDVCRGLGIDTSDYDDNNFNTLNFERIKWGGIRHNDLSYIMFNLEQFLTLDISEPTSEDIDIFKNIIKTIEQTAPNDAARQLSNNLKDVLPATKAQRDVIVEILFHLGVIKQAKTRPMRGPKNDWACGLDDWRGEDGINIEALNKYFKQYL